MRPLFQGDVRGECPPGRVALVGAGPGDPELLTVKAVRLLESCDVVVHDRLVAPAVVALARPQAERIFVGKACGNHTLPQAEINRLLIDQARRGRQVVRLKGGDPMVFGRGGEELAALVQAGICCQIVPGITAALGCAAYAGIPLTHRDHAQAVIFATAHSREGRVAGLDWGLLARPRQTVVIYMGLQALPLVVAGLIQHGCQPDLPAALIERGTTAEQRVLTATLAELPGRALEARVVAPALMIIGAVVGLRECLRLPQILSSAAFEFGAESASADGAAFGHDSGR